MEANQTSAARVAAKIARKPNGIRSRKICPGGVGFETRSASGRRGAVLVANLTRLGLHGVSVRMIGIRLGLQISKPDDKHVNANGGVFKNHFRFVNSLIVLYVCFVLFYFTICSSFDILFSLL